MYHTRLSRNAHVLHVQVMQHAVVLYMGREEYWMSTSSIWAEPQHLSTNKPGMRSRGPSGGGHQVVARAQAAQRVGLALGARAVALNAHALALRVHAQHRARRLHHLLLRLYAQMQGSLLPHLWQLIIHMQGEGPGNGAAHRCALAASTRSAWSDCNFNP